MAGDDKGIGYVPSATVTARKPGATAGAPATSTRAAQPARDPMEGIDIIQAEPGYAKPSILVMGDSKTGKTHALKMILRRLSMRNERGLVLGIENKWQALSTYGPKVVFITKPVVDGGRSRPPTASEMYDRLWRVVDALAIGALQRHQGEHCTALLGDGLMEVCAIVERHVKATKPVSSTGEKNSYALWDMIGAKSIDFFKSMRDAASEGTRVYGAHPLAVVMTCGATLKAESALATPTWTALLPGNIGKQALPFQFEVILHLFKQPGGDGEPIFTVATSSGEDYIASTPQIDGIPARIVGTRAEHNLPDVGEVFDRLLLHYATVGDEAVDEDVRARSLKLAEDIRAIRERAQPRTGDGDGDVK